MDRWCYAETQSHKYKQIEMTISDVSTIVMRIRLMLYYKLRNRPESAQDNVTSNSKYDCKQP